MSKVASEEQVPLSRGEAPGEREELNELQLHGEKASGEGEEW